ncbi:MAG: hypothetical protein GY770_01010 [Aestuariibacter sp.]|nr:hypothetical protein [Aestuariibacter sp.]
MATSKNNQKGQVPEFEVFQIMDIEGRDKGKFYPIVVGFTNTRADDGSINLMTVHGKLQIRIPKSS